jgi:glycosyltransferase involved in cell wall biosynthesis
VALRNLRSEVADIENHVDYYDGMEIVGRPRLPELVDVRRLCQEREVDVLHAHDAGSQFVASALRLTSPTLRVVMTFHRTLGLESEGMRNHLRNAVSLPMVQRVVTASRERRDYFLKHTMVPAARMRVIPFGIDLNVFHPDPASRAMVRRELGLPADALLIMTIGHFGREKGVDQAIEAVAQAAPQLGNRPWHLAVLGGGPPDQVAAMRAIAARLPAGRVTFLGFRPDVAHLLQGADVLLHAPRAEAFGLAVIQAMASALPIVGTSVGGLPEIVVDGQTGHLVRAGDIGGLGAAIVQLVETPGTRIRMADAALRRARAMYGAALTAERHLALYEDVMQSRSHGMRKAS